MNKAWGLLLDLVYPPRCGGCDQRGSLLCALCQASIEPPSSADLQLNQLNLHVCAGGFRGPLRSVIHNFKYNSDTPLAKPLAQLLSNALEQSERFAEVAEILKETGFEWVRRSENPSERDKRAEIILLDSIGELRAAYPLAEIVFDSNGTVWETR